MIAARSDGRTEQKVPLVPGASALQLNQLTESQARGQAGPSLEAFPEGDVDVGEPATRRDPQRSGRNGHVVPAGTKDSGPNAELGRRAKVWDG